MRDATRPEPRSGTSGRAARRLLVAVGITVAVLIAGVHSSGSSTPVAPAVATSTVGLTLPIVTPPPNPTAVQARTASALKSGGGPQAFLDELNEDGGPDFVAVPDASLVTLVLATCADLARGTSVGQVLEDTGSEARAYQPPWRLTDEDVGFVVGAAVAGQCPQFTSRVERWALVDNTDAGAEP
jgi:hypothetical protein